MNKQELDNILELHKKWLNNEEGGEYANLQRANLQYANLRHADLRGADLQDADLQDADLRGADLQDADLQDANLRGADLQDANLRGADLQDADLQDADLRGADLDFSCLPLWCGSLTAHFDEKQVKQFLYHTLSVVSNSKNVSEELKKQLLTTDLVAIANEFHRVGECPVLQVFEGKVIENEPI